MKKILFALVIGLILASTTSSFAVVVPPIRGNAGATSDYVDTLGNTWVPIPAYSAGNWGFGSSFVNYSTSNPIAGTDDDPLFQTSAYRSSGTQWLLFDISNGDYQVNLLFAEPFFTLANKRRFDVEIEDVLALNDYDIYADVGKDTATVKTFSANVADGQLTIELIPVAGQPLICGVSVDVIPEPATLLLLGGGLSGILAFGRRKK